MAGGTIAALASPPGGGERALIRVSGPRAAELVRAVWRGAPLALEGRGVHRGRFDDGRGTQPLLLLWMPGPRSFTREDVAEFHLPGAVPLAQAALERLFALGARRAEPGEFTRRAFHAGRIDLTRAEGLLELVLAESESERAAAAELVGGGLAQRIEALRGELLDLAALCEAGLDFEEADTGPVAASELERRAQVLLDSLAEALSFETARARRGAQARVLLAGAPNAGKSTLFNALLGRAEALVDERAGTTRDPLRAELALGGSVCLLIDSAGLEGAADELARAAQAATSRALAAADLVLWVVDAASATRESLLAAREELGPDTPRLLVWNQVDRAGAPARPTAQHLAAAGVAEWVATSGRTGAGVAELEHALARALEGTPHAAVAPGALRELSARHREALRRAGERVRTGLEAERTGAPRELLAEDLRAALAELDAISGSSTPDDVLERIFARFCIGK